MTAWGLMGNVTVQQAKTLDVSPLLTQADEWATASSTLDEHRRTLAGNVAESADYWQGSAGDAMRDRHATVAQVADRAVTALSSGATAARSGHSAISDAQNYAQRTITDAESAGYQVENDGTVKPSTAQLTYAAGLGSPNSQVVLAALNQGADNHTRRIQPALTGLGRTLDTAASTIDAVFTGPVHADTGAPQPPDGWSKDPAIEWAQRIAYGHPWDKHRSEFPGFSQDNLAGLVHTMMTTPGNMVGKGVNKSGQEVEVMYRDGVVLVLDPTTDDMGTVFRPKTGMNAFVNITDRANPADADISTTSGAEDPYTPATPGSSAFRSEPVSQQQLDQNLAMDPQMAAEVEGGAPAMPGYYDPGSFSGGEGDGEEPESPAHR